LKKLIQLKRGDEAVETVMARCSEWGVDTASVHGIGTTNKARLGFYDPSTGTYETFEFDEQMEVLSLTGNITQRKGRPHIHLHVVLSDSSFGVRGGHVHSLIADPILEIAIIESDEKKVRRGEGPILLFD